MQRHVASGRGAIACWLTVSASLVAACGGASTTPSPSRGHRLLVVSYAADFRHDSIPRAEAVLADLARQNGTIVVSYARSLSDVQRALARDALADVDGVFFANTTGDIGMPDLPAFLAWVRAGHVVLATHSATDTYHNEPTFLDMIGAEFDTHGDIADVAIEVEDRGHPATAGLPTPWPTRDEIYRFRTNPRPLVHVLLSLGRDPTSGAAGDLVLAWTKPFGAGKVFYTALGHRPELWDDVNFRAHLAGALRWAFGA